MYKDSEMKEFYLKTYVEGTEVLVAVCDCQLLGKKFVEGHLQMEVSRDFFGDKKASDLDVEMALSKATIANFVGCRAVEQAIKLGYVERENILSIKGIICAQMVKM